MSPRTVTTVGALATLALLTAPLFLAPFTVTLLNYIGVYSFVALGLVLLTGTAGMVSFGQASFMGVAAYATAWTTSVMGYSPWLGLLLALVATCTVAAILGAVTLRLGGHFLSLSTIAWGLALYFSFGNIPGLGAHDGISKVPAVSIFGHELVESGQIFYLIWGMLLLAMLLIHGSAVRCGRCVAAMRLSNPSASTQCRSGWRLLSSPLFSRPSRAGSTRISTASSARRRSTSQPASFS